MGEVTTAQGIALLEGLFLGVLLATLYDMTRVVRARLKLPLLGYCLDLVFWLLFTVLVFLWAQLTWNGYIRLYALLSIALGASLYFMTFTRITLWLGFLLADFIHFLLKILYLPIAAVVALEKKIKKFAKNLFLFWQKWYRIDSMIQAMDATELIGQEQKRGAVDIVFHKCWNVYQNRNHRHSHLSGGGFADSHGRNTKNTERQPRAVGRGRSTERRK